VVTIATRVHTGAMADTPPLPADGGPPLPFPPLLALEGIREAFYVCDPQWRIVFFNACAERHFGRRREEVLGRSVYDVFPAAAGSAFDGPLRRAMLERGTARVEAPSVRQDGRWVEVEVAPCGDGLSVQVRDISERKAIETRLREREASLAEADRRKDEFLAVLSHELRNPLAPLTNALRLLERSEALGAPEREWLSIAGRQRAQLKRLVDDLLEVSRVSRGLIALRCESMSVRAAVRDALEGAEPLARDRGQRLEATLPGDACIVEADPARIAQILGNLLHNASKFTPEGGTIRLIALERDHEVELRVEDTGIGIEAAQLPRLFEPFVQLDAGEGRAAGGLGIGLALVRRLAELHGGRAGAASDGPGRGAAFSVTLPRCARPDAPPVPKVPAGA
jgi:PAS domain S-box-containing protein